MAVAGRLDLRTLLPACVHLARRGGKIIREVHASGALHAHNKKLAGDNRSVEQMAGNEVLTVADGRAQDAIITSLRSMFPALRLVGEEGEVPQEEKPTPLADVSKFEHAFEVPQALQDSLTTADTCMWVDPLDGTKEFVLGNVERVTVLIGIAVKDRPVAGVIFQPFVADGAGSVTYGALGCGVYQDGRRLPTLAVDKVSITASSHTYQIARIKDGIESMDPKPESTLGNASGFKFLKLFKGENQVFLSGPGCSRWDTCAGEALLEELGGKTTDLDGTPYAYVEESCYDNVGGHIAAASADVHDRFVEAFKEGPSEKKARLAE
eukprot:TRINITY_DN20284_c0_g1_i1.p1 TRINITY_DN20284_c0_g1~~TRINITY_DN20284_c0_g1_i1.p1  ORF type:complete len:323 (-),score=60.99 TRINITY_DN20284_c0_g1_i1:45-1013(-)